MRRLFLFVLVLLLAVYSFYRVDRMRRIQALPPKLLLLPSKEMTRVISFGYKLLTSELIFFDSMFFIGSLEEPPDLSTSREISHTMDTVAYLDPYNMDGYYFAQGVMSWNRTLMEPLNSLLRRGMAHRTWDWQLPFFYGFNQFYFLNRPREAAVYLQKAYELNPGNEFLPTLIARLYYQADATEVAIEFLEKMIRNSNNEKLRQWMTVRLEALRIVAFLEDALDNYKKRFQRRPQNLEALVADGILKAIPADPYGGRFYLDERGRVQTTSKFAQTGKSDKARSSDTVLKGN